MKCHAKAPSAGSTERNGKRRLGGLLAILALALCALGSGAPAASAAPPVVTMGTATAPSYTTAHVSGEVDPNGEPVEWFFEVSTNGTDWQRAGLEGGFEDPKPTDPQAVAGDLQFLTPGTTYKVRLSAINANECCDAVSTGAPYPEITTLTPSAPVVTIDPVTTFTATTAHFSGHVTPGGSDPVFATDWEFKCSPLPCPGLSGHIDPVGAGTTPEEVKFDVKGLEPNSTYNVELIATNQGGQGKAGPVSFKTPASAPSALTLPAFPLQGATSALFGGRVNPRNSATTWWVEYGPTSTYGQSTQPEEAGSGGSAKLVSGLVSGLAPGATYHFRLVAKGAGLTTPGDDVTFTMPVSSGPEACENAQYRVGASAALPDCRAYELASPPDAHISAWSLLDNGSDRSLPPWGQVAADGSAVLWRAQSAVPGVPDSAGQFDTYRSVRGAGSWQSRYLGAPSRLATVVPPNLQFASANADRLLWQTFNATIDPSDHDPVPPLSEINPGNNLRYRDLYTTAADGTITHVNRGSIEVSAPAEEPIFVGASEDLHEVLFTTNRQLVSEAPSGGVRSTYWTDGQTTELVSKDEVGTPFINPGYVGRVGLAADGSIAVFTGGFGQSLYVWSAQSGATEKAFGPVFPGAPEGDIGVDSISADGKLIFFVTKAALSVDDTDTSRDLYEYDTSTDQITLLSAPSGGGASGNSDACAAPLQGEGSYAQCDVAPVIESPDGSVAYFVSPEQIVPGHGVDGGVNLYRAAGGDIRFVATLDPSDPAYPGTANSGGDITRSIKTRHVRLTPDRSKLIFESRAALTSYDNAGFTEIYLYDPTSGAIVCASCRADGAPPTADSTLFNYSGGAQGLIGGYYSVYSANADTHGDHLFFNSGDAIVPQDVNGKNDVYEYTVATGTPSLISTGRSEVDSAYAGSGLDGRDVFFFTADSLVSQDQNGAVYKVYDARRGGGFPGAPVPPAPCDGEGCHGAPSSAPATARSATSTFSAPGNRAQLRCKKGTRRVRSNGKTRCAKKQRKHHHKRDAKHNRGAGR